MLVPHLLKIYFGLGWPSSVPTILKPSKSILKNCEKPQENKQTKKIILKKGLFKYLGKERGIHILLNDSNPFQITNYDPNQVFFQSLSDFFVYVVFV